MSNNDQKNSCKICFFAFLTSIVFLVVLGAHLWVTIQKVRTGQGFEVFYITFYSPRYGMTYLTALFYYIVFALFLALSPLIHWLSTKEERSFKKKYHIDE